MQDLSRAAATALWSGMSVSSPADAAAADLHRTSGPCVSTRARKHRIPIRTPSVGRQRVSVATCGGSGRSGGQQRKATPGKATARRGRGL